jgi:hypothetical protein
MPEFRHRPRQCRPIRLAQPIKLEAEFEAASTHFHMGDRLQSGEQGRIRDAQVLQCVANLRDHQIGICLRLSPEVHVDDDCALLLQLGNEVELEECGFADAPRTGLEEARLKRLVRRARMQQLACHFDREAGAVTGEGQARLASVYFFSSPCPVGATTPLITIPSAGACMKSSPDCPRSVSRATSSHARAACDR